MRHLKSFLPFILGLLLVSISCSTDNSDPLIVDTEGTDGGATDDGDMDDSTDGETDSTVYDINDVLALFSGTDLSYEISGDNVIFTTTDLPNHKSPYWDTSNELYEAYNGDNEKFNLNPNRISEQNIVFTIPLKPSAANNNETTSLGPMGISRNGVVFFNQYAGPNNQALTNEINSFDQYLGHPQNSGQYHYHIEPTNLTGEFGADAFLGLLADGFPVYGPMENDAAITNDDLDDFHGHISTTAEFPDGIYHYHITDADPYLNGSGFYGTPGNISQ